jgi:hypothetical protein
MPQWYQHVLGCMYALEDPPAALLLSPVQGPHLPWGFVALPEPVPIYRRGMKNENICSGGKLSGVAGKHAGHSTGDPARPGCKVA